MILVPNSESLREFNSCHAPDSGQFCSEKGTGSTAFKAWFGDSKVVDASGKPLRAFHGTASDFDEFNTEQPEKPSRGHWAGDLGAWFTAPSKYEGNYDEENAEDVASGFADDSRTGRPKLGANLRPVYLAVRNPKEYADYEEFRDDRGRVSGTKMRARLVAEGYDGVVIRNSMTDGDTDRDDWVVFTPYQVKSAIGNRGTWSPLSRKITEFNSCHAPDSGKFCSEPGTAAWERGHAKVESALRDVVEGGRFNAIVQKHPTAVRLARKVLSVLTTMKRQGYNMPEGVSVALDGAKKPHGLTYAKSDDANPKVWLDITFPDATPEGANLDKMVQLAFQEHRGDTGFTVRTVKDIVVHEMGHVQDRAGHTKLRGINDWPHPSLFPRIKEAALSVSHYASTHAGEFIAETFTKLYRGDKVSKAARKMYALMKGPAVR